VFQLALPVDTRKLTRVAAMGAMLLCRGPADSGGFLALFADPDREGAAWAVVKNADEIAYYATGTAGRFWKRTCTEYLFPGSGSCDVPDTVLQFQLNLPSQGSNIGQ